MPILLEIGLTNAVVATGLGLFVWLITRVLRRPAVVHGLWLLVLLKLVTPPLVRMPVGDLLADRSWAPPSARSERVEPARVRERPVAPIVLDREVPFEGGMGESNPRDAASLPPIPAAVQTSPTRPSAARWDVFQVLAVAWSLGSALVFLLLTYRLARFRRLLRGCRPASAGLEREVAELSRQMGLRRPPRVVLVPGLVSPFVWTHRWRAGLYFPEALLDRLDGPQRTTLLAHELAHLRRRDHWVRWFELPVTVLYWWHPVVWWARREIRSAEEQCCDAWVVWTLPQRRRDYARALMQTVEFLSESRTPVPASVTGAGQVHLLKRRLAMIVRGKTKRSMSFAGWLAVALLAALVLPTLPSWGLSDESEADEAQPKQTASEESTSPSSEDAEASERKAVEFLLEAVENSEEIEGATATDEKTARPKVEYLPQPTNPEKKILQALDDWVTFEFNAASLTEIAGYVRNIYEIPIQIEEHELEDLDLNRRSNIHISVKGVRLASALRLVLSPLELAYVVEDEVLKITSHKKADETLITRVYLLHDLWTEPKDAEELVEAIKWTVSADDWDPVGPGWILPNKKSRSFIVMQTYHVHEELLGFLRILRKAYDDARDAETGNSKPSEPSAPAENSISLDANVADPEAAKRAYEALRATYEAGRLEEPAGVEQLYLWSRRWMEAEAHADPDKRITAIEGHLKRMNVLANSIEAKYAQGLPGGSGAELSISRYYQIEARALLAAHTKGARAPVSRLDGEVVYVSRRLGLVWINLGKNDDMKAGRKYVIYSKSNRMERKAEIEVTGVRGPHLSEARVTEFVPGDAMGILEGDLILAVE